MKKHKAQAKISAIKIMRHVISDQLLVSGEFFLIVEKNATIQQDFVLFFYEFLWQQNYRIFGKNKLLMIHEIRYYYDAQ